MRARKKIISYFLLIAYLMVVSHKGTCQNALIEGGEKMPTQLLDHVNECEFAHPDHFFHVGIFHFLGHLIEIIHHADDVSDNYCFGSYDLASKKVIDQKINLPVNYLSGLNQSTSSEKKSPRAPPYLLSLRLQLTLSNTPLRAPPAIS